MKTRLMLLMLLSVFVLFGVDSNMSLTNAAEKPIVWKFVCDWPPNDLGMQKVVPKLEKWVKESSGGRLIIETYSGGQLVAPSESFDNLRNGTFQLLHSCGAYQASKMPVLTLGWVLPMGPRGADDWVKLHIDYGIFNLLDEAYNELGAKLLTMTPCSGANLLTSKPVRTLDDLKGLKIRVSSLPAKLWAAAGASPVFIPGGETYLALQNGTVDGAVWSNQALDGMKFSEVTKYMLSSYPNPPGDSTTANCGSLIVNKKAFDALPHDLQKILTRVAVHYGQYNAMIYKQWEEWFANGGGKEEMGVEVITLSKKDTDKLRQIAMKDVWAQTASKDARSAKFIEIVTRFLKDEGVID